MDQHERRRPGSPSSTWKTWTSAASPPARRPREVAALVTPLVCPVHGPDSLPGTGKGSRVSVRCASGSDCRGASPVDGARVGRRRAGMSRGHVDHAGPAGAARTGRREARRRSASRSRGSSCCGLLAFTRHGELPLGKLGSGYRSTRRASRAQSTGSRPRASSSANVIPPTDGRRWRSITRSGRADGRAGHGGPERQVFARPRACPTRRPHGLYRLLEKVRQY